MKSRHLFTIITAVALWCLTGFSAPANAAPVDPSLPAPAVLNPVGVWRWTTQGRNGQPEETVLKLAVDKGQVTGTLTDRAGDHPLTNVSLRGNNVEFAIVRDTPNGKVPIEYSLTLESRNPKVSIERPDFTSSARKAGKKRKTELNVTRAEGDNGSKPKD